MSSTITKDGLETAISNLQYRNPKLPKTRLIEAIRSFYSAEDALETVSRIDSDDLIRMVWEIDDNPALIKSKRKNLHSIKVIVNNDLMRLFQDKKNPEGITIGPLNTFVMSEAAREKLLSSFADSAKSQGNLPLEKVAEVLNVISEFISEIENINAENPKDQVKKVLDLIKGMAAKAGLGGTSDIESFDGNKEAHENSRMMNDNIAGAGLDPGNGSGAELEEISADKTDEIEDAEIEEVDADIDLEEIDEEELIETDDADMEEIDEDIVVDEVDADEIEEIDDVDLEEIDPAETDEIEDAEIEEVDADIDLEEIDEEDLIETDDADMEETDEDIVIDDVDADEIEEVDDIDLEEIDPDETEDAEIEEIDADIDLEEIDADPVEEIDDADLEEVNTDEIEEVDADEVEEIAEDELGLPRDNLEQKDFQSDENLLAEQFDGFLGSMERFYNQYLLIPGGSYLIGNNSNSDIDLPEQQISLPDFYIGKYPISNALFEVFVERTGYKTTAERAGYGWVYTGRFRKQEDPKTGARSSVWKSTYTKEKVKGAYWYQPSGPGSTLHGKRNHPVVQISIQDAVNFSAWIGKRLPTEFEWEAAARTTKGYQYPWGSEWVENACNYEQSAVSDTTPVNQYANGENSLGIADTLCNVLEWTSDQVKPISGKMREKTYHIAKGGSWISDRTIQLSNRFRFESGFTANILGFRCVAD